MKRISAVVTLLLLAAAGAVAAPSASAAPAPPLQRVVLAGGCFWGMQLVFESVKGVRSAVAGYSGGMAATAHYEIVSTGETGHAESVEVTYDPAVGSFHDLLEVYFLVAHDPTELNRQGPDEGTQYRSEIYYTTPAQRNEAKAEIAKLDASHVFSSPIVTKVAPLDGFYAAEAYHQNYAVNNPSNPYIAFNDIPKLHALKAKYPQLVKANAPNL